MSKSWKTSVKYGEKERILLLPSFPLIYNPQTLLACISILAADSVKLPIDLILVISREIAGSSIKLEGTGQGCCLVIQNGGFHSSLCSLIAPKNRRKGKKCVRLGEEVPACYLCSSNGKSCRANKVQHV